MSSRSSSQEMEELPSRVRDPLTALQKLGFEEVSMYARLRRVNMVGCPSPVVFGGHYR
jgi:hypothetical protein